MLTCNAGGPFTFTANTCSSIGLEGVQSSSIATSFAWSVEDASGNSVGSITDATAQSTTFLSLPGAARCNEGALTARLTVNSDDGQVKSCTAPISVAAVAAPDFSSQPSDVNAAADDVPSLTLIGATDKVCHASATVTVTEENNHVNDSTYQLVRTWTAAGTCLDATHTQVVTVIDNTPTALTGVEPNERVACPAIPLPCEVIARDLGENILVSCVEERITGSCNNDYKLVRTWSATDAALNVATESQTIEIYDDADPTLVGAPVDQTVDCDQIPAAATITANDNCDELVTVTGPVETTQGGKIVRVWSATDACGNTVSHSQTLTIVDDVAPVITGSDLEDHAATCQSPPTPCEAVAVDNCDDPVMIITGTSTVAGSCPSDFLRIFTFTATDSAGNEAVVSQTITVTDTEKPQLLNLPPATVTMTCDEIEPVAVGARDNCDAHMSVVLTTDDRSSTAPQVHRGAHLDRH